MAFHVRYDTFAHTSDNLAQQIDSQPPGTVITGSIGRMGLYLEAGICPLKEFTERQEIPTIKLGSLARDIDMPFDTGNTTGSPFPLDRHPLIPPAFRMLPGNLGKIVVIDTKTAEQIGDPISEDVFEPVRVEALGVPINTLSAATSLALLRSFGFFRPKDRIAESLLRECVTRSTQSAPALETLEEVGRVRQASLWALTRHSLANLPWHRATRRTYRDLDS